MGADLWQLAENPIACRGRAAPCVPKVKAHCTEAYEAKGTTSVAYRLGNSRVDDADARASRESGWFLWCRAHGQPTAIRAAQCIYHPDDIVEVLIATPTPKAISTAYCVGVQCVAQWSWVCPA